MMNAIVADDLSASAVQPERDLEQVVDRGLDTFRISSEQIVMPSWLVASISVACSMAHSAVFAGARARPRRAARSASGARR